MRNEVLALLIAIFLLSGIDCVAQRCIGSTRYAVRDQAGKILSGENLKRLTVKSINGIPVRLNSSPNEIGTFFYEADFVRGFYQDNVAREFRRETRTVLENSNPLIFGAYNPSVCGKIGDLTLEYRGVEMRLIFDIPEHNTRYLIDSLPFQAGTFYRGALRCADGGSPPMIDNNTTGKCVVATDTWTKADATWKRPLRWTDSWSSRLNGTDPCPGRKVEAISRHTEWVDAWALHHGTNRNDPLPAIDFTTEVILIVHLPATYRLGHDSAWTNLKGELIFPDQPSVRKRASLNCTVWMLRIYRSGIKSVDGRPLGTNND